MAVSKQNWYPDTCQCVVEELHDPANPAFGVQFSKVISKCPAHNIVADARLYGALYSDADGENKRKNLLHKFLLENTTLAAIDASGTFQFKAGISMSWSFDANRVLNITITGTTLTGAQRTAINNFCTTTFGTGKINLL